MRKYFGFTLVELLVALIVMAILSTVVVVSYLDQHRKAKRTDAIQTLLAMQLAQEKYRAKNSTYGDLFQIWNGVSSSDRGYYTVSISNITATSYDLVAIPIGDQNNDAQGGVNCNPMVLSYSNGTTTKTPAQCWFE